MEKAQHTRAAALEPHATASSSSVSFPPRQSGRGSYKTQNECLETQIQPVMVHTSTGKKLRRRDVEGNSKWLKAIVFKTWVWTAWIKNHSMWSIDCWQTGPRVNVLTDSELTARKGPSIGIKTALTKESQNLPASAGTDLHTEGRLPSKCCLGLPGSKSLLFLVAHCVFLTGFHKAHHV